MPIVATPAFAQTIVSGLTRILPADTTTLKTLFTAGADGSLIDIIHASSTDTSSRDLQFWISSGGVDYLFCTVNVSANGGNNNSSAIVSILNSARLGALNEPTGWYVFDSNGNKLLRLAAGESLKVGVLTTVTTGRVVYVRASGVNM